MKAVYVTMSLKLSLRAWGYIPKTIQNFENEFKLKARMQYLDFFSMCIYVYTNFWIMYLCVFVCRYLLTYVGDYRRLNRLSDLLDLE